MTDALAAIRFSPGLPVWLLGALAGLCVLVLAVGAWRRARGTVLRALAFAVLLAWLAGPRLVRETRQALSDIALLVVDQSASMGVGDRAALAEAARRGVAEQAAKLPGLELRTVSVPEAGHDGTRLFAAMAQALADIPRARLAGVVAITDGQVHDIPSGPGAAGLDAAPLHVLLPAAGEQVDRRLRVVEAPPYGIVGRSVTLRVVVEDLGASDAGAQARLTLRRDGDPPVVRSVAVGREQSIELPITRAGQTLVELSVDTLPAEVSAINNRTVLAVNGVRDRLRVLLVSGEPNQGERVWRTLLKSDPSVDLVHFTILRPPERDDMTPLNELALIAFPIRELFQLKIDQFDLIILDRFQNRGILPLAYLRNIADYVRKGGALLLSVGPEFAGSGSLADTPLGGVLPVRAPDPDGAGGGVVEQAFRPSVSALGLRHPVTAGLPGATAGPGGTPGWGSWYRAIAPAEVDGQAVMGGPDGQPLLVLGHVGQGRAAMLLSDQIWLWARGHQGGGPQGELLRRVSHWLMKEPALEEEALDARLDPLPGGGGELHVERRTLSDAPPPPVTVTAPDGTRTTLALAATGPGRASAQQRADAPGVWQAGDGTHAAFAAAQLPNPEEYADLRATATRLEPLARATGGGVHWLQPGGAPQLRRMDADGVASGAGWIGLRRRGDHLVTGVDTVPLLPPWAALPLLLGLVVAAWWREGA